VVWDAEDETSDAYLKAGFMAAKALAVRARMENAERTADFQAIDKSLTEIQRQVKYLDEIRTWSGTIKNSAEKVIDRVERMQKALDAELENLGEQVAQLKGISLL
jgi:flagellin-like hook-associated protein FlgL